MTDSELSSYANRVKNMSRDWTIVRLHDIAVVLSQLIDRQCRQVKCCLSFVDTD